MAPQAKPKDTFHCVGIIFFLLGLGTLLPWNFFITAIPYFQSRLTTGNCSAAEDDGNQTAPALELGSRCGDGFNFSNWLALLSQLPLLLFTLLNSLLYQCIPDTVRILGSLVGILLLFVLTAVLVQAEMSPWSFFSVTMASVWFINSFCAILQGSLFGQLGSFPQSYSTLFLSGQGMAGTFAAVAMLLSMASGADARTSALGYFVTPCVGTLISILCYLLLPHKVHSRPYLYPILAFAKLGFWRGKGIFNSVEILMVAKGMEKLKQHTWLFSSPLGFHNNPARSVKLKHMITPKSPPLLFID